MSIFDSIFSITGNIAKVVLAPVEMALDVVDAAVQPIADAAKDMVDDVKSIKD